MSQDQQQSRPAPPASILQLWRDCDAVVFDVDSTVVQEEGIDVLAAHCGVGEQVAALTKRAMEGGVPFEVALASRLELIQPTRARVASCLAAHPPRLTEGMRELFGALRAAGKRVFLVSGGFRQMIRPVARELHIQEDELIANTLLFAGGDGELGATVHTGEDERTPSAPAAKKESSDSTTEDGAYLGFDTNEPTSRSGGKPLAIARLKEKFGLRKVVMIGDGATDLEARPPADAVIGFGGIVVRERVQRESDWFVFSAHQLIDALQ